MQLLGAYVPKKHMWNKQPETCPILNKIALCKMCFLAIISFVYVTWISSSNEWGPLRKPGECNFITKPCFTLSTDFS